MLKVTKTVPATSSTVTAPTRFSEGDAVTVSGLSFPRPGGISRTIPAFAAHVTKVTGRIVGGKAKGVKYTVKGDRFGKVHIVSPKQLKAVGAVAPTAC